MSRLFFFSVPFLDTHRYMSSSIPLQVSIQSSRKGYQCDLARSRFQHFSPSIYLQCTVCMQLIIKLHVPNIQDILVKSRVLPRSCRCREANPVLAEVEHRVVSSHEDITKNPAMVHMQALRLRWKGKMSRYDAMFCSSPERTTWGRYVECHEPADADSLASLLQLHNVLQHKFNKV